MADQETPVRWETACAVAALSEGAPKGLTLRGIPIALYKVGGAVYATHDVCTHAYANLSDGFMEGHVVECPLHGALYDVRSGKCLAVGSCDLKTYPVQVEGAEVRVLVPDPAKT